MGFMYTMLATEIDNREFCIDTGRPIVTKDMYISRGGVVISMKDLIAGLGVSNTQMNDLLKTAAEEKVGLSVIGLIENKTNYTESRLDNRKNRLYLYHDFIKDNKQIAKELCTIEGIKKYHPDPNAVSYLVHPDMPITDPTLLFNELCKLYSGVPIDKDFNKNDIPAVLRVWNKYYPYHNEINLGQFMAFIHEYRPTVIRILDMLPVQPMQGLSYFYMRRSVLSAFNPSLEGWAIMKDAARYFSLKFIQKTNGDRLESLLTDIMGLCNLLREANQPIPVIRINSINEYDQVHEMLQVLLDKANAHQYKESMRKHKWHPDLVAVVKENGWWIPETIKELQNRGIMHRNCVGSYARAHFNNPFDIAGVTTHSYISPKTLLLFNKSATAELSICYRVENDRSISTELTIEQCKGYANSTASKKGLNEIMGWISNRLKQDKNFTILENTLEEVKDGTDE